MTRDSQKDPALGSLSSTPREIKSFAELKGPALDALLTVGADDLDSVGLACYYILCAPSEDLNQCLMSSGTLYLARKLLGADSEVVPAVLEAPETGQRAGRPDPQITPDNQIDGHLVLITDRGLLLDVTAAQFSWLNKSRNGLPIVGRHPDLWQLLCTPNALKDPTKQASIAVASHEMQHLVTYHLHSPLLATHAVQHFIEQGSIQIAKFLTDFTESFVQLVATKILINDRAHEVQLISNKKFRDRILAAQRP